MAIDAWRSQGTTSHPESGRVGSGRCVEVEVNFSSIERVTDVRVNLGILRHTRLRLTKDLGSSILPPEVRASRDGPRGHGIGLRVRVHKVAVGGERRVRGFVLFGHIRAQGRSVKLQRTERGTTGHLHGRRYGVLLAAFRGNSGENRHRCIVRITVRTITATRIGRWRGHVRVRTTW